MNLLLTLDCSLNCDYCFARTRRAAGPRREMTLAELEVILLTLDPDRDPVRLMGGEPTLHSRYAEILTLLKARGYWVVVFTNGLQPILRETAPALPDEVLLNLNDWASYSEAQQTAILTNLRALGRRVGLAYTITRPGFDLSVHRRLTLELGLRPVIRVGLAQPVLDGDNRYLPDADLPAAHTAVARWAQRLSVDGVRLSLDCGFMRCHFDEAALEMLVRAWTALRFDCRPALDVGPGLRVWRCFAFSSGSGLPWAAVWEGKAHFDFDALPNNVRQACRKCSFHAEGWCQGGCLARTLQKQNLVRDENPAGLIFENVGG